MAYTRDEMEAAAATRLPVPAAMIRQLLAESEWQPIETAPRDGTPVDLWGLNLLSYDKRGQRICNVKFGTVTDWIGRENDDWQHGRGEGFEPTHWRPLPAPPKEGA